MVSLYNYLKAVNWWQELRMAVKASWAKAYIWYAVKKDGCKFKLRKAKKALDRLECPSSSFSTICEQIDLAVSCLNTECYPVEASLFDRHLRG